MGTLLFCLWARWRGLGVILLISGYAIGSRGAEALSAAPRAAEGKSIHLETFDAAWRIINDSHFDPSFGGVDWKAVREELRPEAAAAADAEELREILGRMLKRLDLSHMAIIPGKVADALTPKGAGEGAEVELGRGRRGDASADEVLKGGNKDGDNDDADPDEGEESGEAGGGKGEDLAQDADVGFDVRLIGNELVVSKVLAGSPAAKAGIRPGWLLKEAAGRSFGELLDEIPEMLEQRQRQFMGWRLAQANLRGAEGSKVRLRLEDGLGATKKFRLTRRLQPGQTVKFGLLPPVKVDLEHRRLATPGGGTAGVIHFNIWMIPIALPFDKAVDEFREADGIVLDLRGNLGGIAGMILGLSGHFLKERLSLGTMKTRENNLKFLANPRWVNPEGKRVEPYGGPLAILVDEISLSAAEIFAGGLQDLGRARVFGQRSGGQALPAVWDRLPNNDILYHAFADFILPSGRRLEGAGVIPDEAAPLTRENLLAGRDAAMEAALAWVDQQKKAGRSE